MKLKLFQIPHNNGDEKKADLYFRGNTKLKSGEVLSTDTYFGSFSCTKYLKYTCVSAVELCVNVKGEGTAMLCAVTPEREETVICEEKFASDGELKLCAERSRFPREGYLYLKLTTDNECEFVSGYYSAETDENQREIKLGIIFCTFKREEFVRSNINKISEFLKLNDLGNFKVDIFCIDNGNTLKTNQVETAPNIHLVPNKNYGGSGGFTRGMMELISADAGYTHAWVMDDDIEFEPDMILRILSFLSITKPEFYDYHIAAGMMTFEKPTVQYEATANYDGVSFKSNKAELDLCELSALFENEKDISADYGGWWSLNIPMENIRRDSLPLPFFIKLDDVEFGLRSSRKFLTLNGFGVWHQSFANKVSAHLEYYTTRNGLVLTALYSGAKKEKRFLLSRLIKAISFGETKYMAASLKGVEDFLKGPDFLKNTPADKLNSEIMKEYKFAAASPGTRGKMLLCAAKNIFKKSSLESFKLYLSGVKLLKAGYLSSAKMFKDKFGEITTYDFWEEFMIKQKNQP